MPRVSYEKAYDTNGNPVTGVYVPNVGEVPLQGGAITTDGTTGKTPSAPMTAVLVDKLGINQAAVDAFGFQLVSVGGTKYQNVAAAASQSVKASPGRCCRVIVLATGTGIGTIYDNTAGSGQAILQIPASATVGAIYDVQVQTTLGIFAVSAASGPQLLVTYN